MAALETVRSKGVLLLIIIGLALMAFIIGDFLNNSSSIINRDKENVGEVAGEVIKIQDFQDKIEQFTTVYKIETGNQSLDASSTDQINEMVWQDFVKSTLISKEAEEIGLAVSDNELKEATVGATPDPIILQRRVFANPQTGRFDHDLMIRILNQLNTKPSTAEEAENFNMLKSYWSYFEKEVKNSRLQNKYQVLMSKAINTNKLEAKSEFDSEKNTNTALYVYVPYTSVNDKEVAATDNEIKAKYEEVKEAFKINSELRNIDFVVFANSASEEDKKAAEADITKLKNEFAAAPDAGAFANMNSGKYRNVALSANQIDPDFKDFAFSGSNGQMSGPTLFGDTYKMARIVDNTISYPDSIKLSHIVVMEEDAVKTKVLADSILKAIQNGADFATLARKYSKIQQTAQNGGDAGWVLTSQIESESMINALNSHNTGVDFIYEEENSDAVQIIRVTEKTKPVRKAKIAIIESEIRPSKTTTSKNYNIAKEFAANSQDANGFAALAKKKGYMVYPYPNLTSNTPTLQGLENSRDIIRWAYNDETEKNSVSDVYDCGEYFVVATLKDIEEKGYRNIDKSDVKDQVKYMVEREKKAKKISEKMNGVTSIAALESKLNVKADTATDINFVSSTIAKHGNEPKVIAAIALVKQGQLSKPIEGNQGVFVTNVIKTVPNINKFDINKMRQDITTRSLYSVYRSLDALTDKYEVIDNRVRFY